MYWLGISLGIVHGLLLSPTGVILCNMLLRGVAYHGRYRDRQTKRRWTSP